MGGMDLIRHLWAFSHLRFVPFPTLMTETQSTKREETRRTGAQGCLVKPIASSEFLAVLHKVFPEA